MTNPERPPHDRQLCLAGINRFRFAEPLLRATLPPMLYRILIGIDSAAALVALYFFAAGLADGSVSSFNIGIWLALLCGIGAVVGGGIALNMAGYRRTACAVLSILAAPSFLFGLFILALIVFQPRWN
jgi:hypothetical protein